MEIPVYNRFAGNPPGGLTAAQAFVIEMGDLPPKFIPTQDLQAQIDELSTQVTTQADEIASLNIRVTALENPV